MNSGAAGPIVAFPSIERITTLSRARQIELEDRTIHVWGFMLDGNAALMEHCRAWLSVDECARAVRFIRQDDQIQYILAHGGLRAILGRYTGLDPAAVTFQQGVTGKPVLLDRLMLPHPLRFNLSHSHGRMLIAVAREKEVGVDLELIRDTVEAVKLAERYYSPAEQERICRLSRPDQARQFYRYWVAKEAVLKGQAVGLRSLQECEIVLDESLSLTVARASAGSALQSGWMIRWLACGIGWEGAVAAQGRDWGLKIMSA